MKDRIKDVRVHIDGLAHLAKELDQPVNYEWEEMFDETTGRTNPFIQPHSKEIDKATDSLFLAKAWFGKVLGELEGDWLYPKDGSIKTVKDIERTADIETGNDWKYSSLNTHIEQVVWLIREIQRIVKEWEFPGIVINSELGPHVYGYKDKAVHHLSEALFWLEFELERIREEDER